MAREAGSDTSNLGGIQEPVEPTWYGWVELTEDALIVIEACITQRLKRVRRRPDENERPTIVQSGAVFVFDESTTGILRWTDDRNWSPSRVRGNFMLYRELDSKVPPGEKKKAIKKSKPPSSGPATSQRSSGEKSRMEVERSVRGSHTDSYKYKEVGGLMKRTLAAYYGDTKWSVISYYDPNQVEAGLLPKVSDDPILTAIQPRPELKCKSLQPSGPQKPHTSQLFLPADGSVNHCGYDLSKGAYPMSSSAQSPVRVSHVYNDYSMTMPDSAGSYHSAPITPVYPSPSSYDPLYTPSRGKHFPNSRALPQDSQTQAMLYRNDNQMQPQVYHISQQQQSLSMHVRAIQYEMLLNQRAFGPDHQMVFCPHKNGVWGPCPDSPALIPNQQAHFRKFEL